MVDIANSDLIFKNYCKVRNDSQAWVVDLSAEDMVVQSMPDVSPTKWHLAHTTWFWETFLLREHLPGYQEFSTEFNYLFNSYYDRVGARHPRPERGLLTRPSIDEVMAYRTHVDAGMASLLEIGCSEKLQALIALGLAHEEQHQELMLMDIKHVLSRHPFAPVAFSRAPVPAEGSEDEASTGWIDVKGGVFAFGMQDDGFHFDNEGPVHQAVLTDFALARHPVTNAEYLAFIEDGGYADPTLWLSDGWAHIQGEGWTAPLYWRREASGWREFTLHGEQPLDPHQPVVHLSYYEASAYAEWAGARLPEEREWEYAARTLAGPEVDWVQPGVSAHPSARSAPDGQLAQMMGGVWEWTRSAYSAYPRYKAPPGAVGEYNGKFMCGQFVLRGGCVATPAGHARVSYRNFFPPHARWAFAGLRLAKDI